MEVTPETKATMAGFFASADMRAWGALSPAEKDSFSIVALGMGLHPLSGELMIYQGSLYVTIDGRRRLAMRQPDFAAVQPEMVTDPKTREAMGARRPGDFLARCVLYRKSTPIPTIQYGLVREAERYPSENERQQLEITQAQLQAARDAHDPDMIWNFPTNPKAKVRPVITQPAIMAMKRAEGRALNIIAQSPLPTFDTEIGAPLEDGPNGGMAEGELVQPPPADPRPTVEEAVAAFNESRAAPPPTPREAEEEAQEEAQEAPPDTEEAPDTAPVTTGPPPPRAAKPPADQLPGGLLHIPDTPEKVIRHAVQHLHYRNIAAVLAALNFKAADEITDCAKSWADLVRLAPKTGA
jgi:hypothetical protein